MQGYNLPEGLTFEDQCMETFFANMRLIYEIHHSCHWQN